MRRPVRIPKKVDLNRVEAYADKVMDPVDVEFTNHFFDQLTRSEHKKEITNAELIGFFKRLSKKKKQFDKFMQQYDEFVAKDKRTDINIPFKSNVDQIIAKTIMRKKDFKTSNAEYKFENYNMKHVKLFEQFVNESSNLEKLAKEEGSSTEGPYGTGVYPPTATKDWGMYTKKDFDEQWKSRSDLRFMAKEVYKSRKNAKKKAWNILKIGRSFDLRRTEDDMMNAGEAFYKNWLEYKGVNESINEGIFKKGDTVRVKASDVELLPVNESSKGEELSEFNKKLYLKYNDKLTNSLSKFFSKNSISKASNGTYTYNGSWQSIGNSNRSGTQLSEMYNNIKNMFFRLAWTFKEYPVKQKQYIDILKNAGLEIVEISNAHTNKGLTSNFNITFKFK